MRTLIAEFVSLDGVVQALGGAGEDTDGGFSHGRWSIKSCNKNGVRFTYGCLTRQERGQLHLRPFEFREGKRRRNDG